VAAHQDDPEYHRLQQDELPERLAMPAMTDAQALPYHDKFG
jgi:hypothetical protein